MEWVEASKQSHPDKEGWYLTLFESTNGEVFPLPLYYQFAWNVSSDFDGTIKCYTGIDNLPVELVSGRIF